MKKILLCQEVVEMLEIAATGQDDDFIMMDAEFHIPHVDPMFNKKFYTKHLRFNVEFELIQE